jgi:hypothetical protein
VRLAFGGDQCLERLVTVPADVFENRHRESIMNEDASALAALKNAWAGAVSASDAVRDLGPSVAALDEATSLAALDLETYHRVTLAQSVAVLALRGLVEQLLRKRDSVQPVS